MKRILVLATFAVASLCPAIASAQLGKFLREGVKSVARRTGLVAREGAEEAAEQSAKKVALPALREGVEASAQTAASRNAVQATADFVWENKGSIAVGTAAAAALHPDVAKAALEVTGEQIVRPLIENSAEHVARPVVEEVSREAARVVPWRLVIVLLLGWVLIRWVFRRLPSWTVRMVWQSLVSGRPKPSGPTRGVVSMQSPDWETCEKGH